ncbi:MAG TPA: hypothetical protein PKB06_12955 [Actinotalea sp.]|nr:hypothetical protein [Actinotalea sp.]
MRRMVGAWSRGRTADDGSGAALALALVGLMVTGAAVLAVAVAQLAAGQRARAAADLAALAGAELFVLPAGLVLAEGAVPADGVCARAATVAAHNDAVLSACSVADRVVTVVVRVAGPLGAAGAEARAGPRSVRGG